MKTKVLEKNTDIENNDLATNHYFSIPEKIQKDIDEKWFFLYNWIESKEVKESIERDFLFIIDKLWLLIGAIFTVLIIASYYNYGISAIFFTIWFLSFVMISYILFLAFIRVKSFKNNAYIVLTNKYISINWNIKKLNEFTKDEIIKIAKVERDFQEKIFQESKLKDGKKTMLQSVIKRMKDWFLYILSLWKNSSKKNNWIIILILAYTLYVAIISIIYIIWIWLIHLIWIFVNIVSKKISILYWHKITSINQSFEDIDYYSKEIEDKKTTIVKYLKKAQNNEWSNWLLTEINKKLKEINKNAENSIETNKKLKSIVENSKFSEIFEYETYNNWLKKQILKPLISIHNLLVINVRNLKKQIIEIDKILKKETDPRKTWPLELSKKRINSTIIDLKIHIENLKVYINKIKQNG